MNKKRILIWYRRDLRLHKPEKLSAQEQKHFGVRLGVDYPRPVVNFFQSVKANEKIYNAAVALGKKQ